MRRFSVISIVCLATLIITGCDKPIDLESHRQELLRLNERMRAAHLAGDVGPVLANNVYPYIKVNRGLVSHPTSEEDSARFGDYLSSMKITAWDDLVEPTIIISDDATLATVIYRKYLSMVPIAQPDAEPYEGIFAWQSTYRRTAEGWKQIADIVTSLPEKELTEELKSMNR